MNGAVFVVPEVPRPQLRVDDLTEARLSDSSFTLAERVAVYHARGITAARNYARGARFQITPSGAVELLAGPEVVSEADALHAHLDACDRCSDSSSHLILCPRARALLAAVTS